MAGLLGQGAQLLKPEASLNLTIIPPALTGRLYSFEQVVEGICL